MLSPQTVDQAAPGVAQVYPDSTKQDPLHPSPPDEFPSSQVSEPATTESPQVVVHDEFAEGHVYPDSIAQRLLHPSPEESFPSSQASVPSMIPSPQVVVQALPGVEQV